MNFTVMSVISLVVSIYFANMLLPKLCKNCGKWTKRLGLVALVLALNWVVTFVINFVDGFFGGFLSKLS